MAKDTEFSDSIGDVFGQIMAAQQQMVETVFGQMMPKMAPGMNIPKPEDLLDIGNAEGALQGLWQRFAAGLPDQSALGDLEGMTLPDPKQWLGLVESWAEKQPVIGEAGIIDLGKDLLALWTAVGGSIKAAATGDDSKVPKMPRKDRRFADPLWSQQPAFALLHQSYLLISERIVGMVDALPGLDKSKHAQLKFSMGTMLEALSPANFPLTNPVVIERTKETGGKNLAKGMQHLTRDMERGQLTHTDPDAFELGRNIAVTPGKVVHETDLYQLIQYSPTTSEVYKTPLVIFPPWINRFYILDLNPKKSFIRWAVEQGLTTFVISWKSADESMRDVVWDDYIRAQMDAIDQVRERLKVPCVHAIGYCVAGTTLAATLAIQARRDEAAKVASATFFTAQVDFERAGELLHFIDDQQLASIEALGGKGYLDGRFIALAFNMLRGTDLIWNYVVNNYMLGEDYPAFDLLHWNGDVTNLPAKWHGAYLRDLYRDNKLVTPDAMSADGTPIDLSLVETPTYLQAGREDHIAPAKSVWRMRDHFSGPLRFVLAGSGHIAGVVNPPEAGKYQYWLNEGDAEALDDFIAGATEHKGSWWPDWIDWIDGQDAKKVPAKGKRKPGLGSDKVIEDAPGRYVMTR